MGRWGLGAPPPIRCVAGAMRHVTIDRALRLLGLGSSSMVEVAADEHGRMQADALAEALAALKGPVIVCAQAGEVNTGSFDPLPEIADLAQAARSWLHIDCAFGIWAAASPTLRHLVAGHAACAIWQPVTNANEARAGIPRSSLSQSPATSSMTDAAGDDTAANAF